MNRIITGGGVCVRNAGAPTLKKESMGTNEAAREQSWIRLTPLRDGVLGAGKLDDAEHRELKLLARMAGKKDYHPGYERQAVAQMRSFERMTRAPGLDEPNAINPWERIDALMGPI